jgi:hypothetical protein
MNDGTRVSHFLTEKQVHQLLDAIAYAWRLERPLNFGITINLRIAEIRGRPQKFISAFTKYAGDWLRLRSVAPCYVWVLEIPPGSDPNVHIAFHWPAEHRQDGRELGNLLRGWLKKSGGHCTARALQHQSLPHPCDKDSDPKRHGMYCRYILKGTDPETCKRLGINHSTQGAIVGKRCGTSEHIGGAARRRSPLPPVSTERVTYYGTFLYKHPVFWWLRPHFREADFESERISLRFDLSGS